MSFSVDRILKPIVFAAMQSALIGSASATDVYSSTDSTGQLRWSTQALDTSYKLEPTLKSPSSTPQPLAETGRADAPNARKIWLDQRRSTYRPMVETIAGKHGVNSALVMALIEVESGFNPRAISSKGARGLMQLLPSTAAAYGLRSLQDLYDPAKNIDIGVRHLKDLLNKHDGQWALAMASYNAGAHAVSRHGNRIPSYRETMLYVPAVLAIAAQRPDQKDTPIVGTTVHQNHDD